MCLFVAPTPTKMPTTLAQIQIPTGERISFLAETRTPNSNALRLQHTAGDINTGFFCN